MRVISQDGTMDLPYELIAFSTGYNGNKSENYIFVHSTIFGTDRGTIVARYSTEEKAKKAMDLLHETYVGKKIIAVDAIEHLYNKDCIEYEEIIEEENPHQENEIINILREQIEQQRKEIEFKNKQLEDLTEQLKASSERETNYQTLLNQQQQLTAAEKQKVLLLEDNQKKGFFGIFKKKGK